MKEEPAEDAQPHSPASANVEEDPAESTEIAGAMPPDCPGGWGSWFKGQREKLRQKKRLPCAPPTVPLPKVEAPIVATKATTLPPWPLH